MKPMYLKLSYPGFVTQGDCGITIGHHGGLTIIVCSQKYNNKGTSITNAIEIIATRLFLTLIKDPKFQQHHEFEKLNNHWAYLKKNKILNLGAIYKKSIACWIEHYPVGTGILDEEQFTPVHFTQDNVPIWLPSISARRARALYGKEIIDKAISMKD